MQIIRQISFGMLATFALSACTDGLPLPQTEDPLTDTSTYNPGIRFDLEDTEMEEEEETIHYKS